MKELRIISRVVNNRMRERREALGLAQSTCAESIGISPSRYGELESLKISPLASRPICVNLGCSAYPWLCKKHDQSGYPPRFTPPRWRKSALQIADFFGATVEELFPESVRAIETIEMEWRLDAVDLPQLVGVSPRKLPAPDESLESEEMGGLIDKALATLTSREEEVLRMRFGLGVDEHTLDEVGKALGKNHHEVSQERARQIEQKALRKMRHPSRSRSLEGEGHPQENGVTSCQCLCHKEDWVTHQASHRAFERGTSCCGAARFSMSGPAASNASRG